MSFAIIETGGKQFKVSEGSRFDVEMLKDVKTGDLVTFDKVLLIEDGGKVTIGTPTIVGASVSGKIEKEGKHDKVTVIKYKAKSRYFKKRGHRQPFLTVSITGIKN